MTATMTIEQAIRRARRESGLARIENAREFARELGRTKRAWRVPGTAAAGRWAMARRAYDDLLARWRREGLIA